MLSGLQPLGIYLQAALKEFIHRRIYWFFLSAGNCSGSPLCGGSPFWAEFCHPAAHGLAVRLRMVTLPFTEAPREPQDHALGTALSNRDNMGGCLVTSSGSQRDFQMPYLGPDSPPHLPADPEGPQCEEISNTQLGRSFVWQASFTFPGSKQHLCYGNMTCRVTSIFSSSMLTFYGFMLN